MQHLMKKKTKILFWTKIFLRLHVDTPIWSAKLLCFPTQAVKRREIITISPRQDPLEVIHGLIYYDIRFCPLCYGTVNKNPRICGPPGTTTQNSWIWTTVLKSTDRPSAVRPPVPFHNIIWFRFFWVLLVYRFVWRIWWPVHKMNEDCINIWATEGENVLFAKNTHNKRKHI